MVEQSQCRSDFPSGRICPVCLLVEPRRESFRGRRREFGGFRLGKQRIPRRARKNAHESRIRKTGREVGERLDFRLDLSECCVILRDSSAETSLLAP